MSAPDQDQEHLKLLAIFHYIWGGLTAAMSCFGLIYLLVGIGFLAFGPNMNEAPPAWFGALFLVIGGVAIALAIIVGGLTIWAGRCLAMRKHYIFCVVIAAISCLSVPFGTALGVFTLIVLNRPTVKQSFGLASSSARSA